MSKKKVISKKKLKSKEETEANKELLKLLGKRIQEIRESKNLRLTDVAYPIGKEPQSVSRVEQGDVNPTFLYLVDVCESLDIELADLLKGITKKGV